MKKIVIALVILVIGLCSVNCTKGIDVSHHNNLNWDKLDSDIHFCYIKATEGTNYIDPKLEYNSKKATEKDMYIGYYHYFRTNTSGKEQFENFKSILNTHNSGLIPVIDVEDKNNNYDNLSIENLKTFIELFYSEYKYYPIIYYGSRNAFIKTYKHTYKCKWWTSLVPGFTAVQYNINNLDYNYTLNINRLIKS